MQKIPTVFTYEPDKNGLINITDKIADGCNEAFRNGKALTKIDGCCCAIINDEFYKYDSVTNSKKVPKDAIPCHEFKTIGENTPYWIKINPLDPRDKWFVAAYETAKFMNPKLENGTYEAIGPHFQNNPYRLSTDSLIKHTNTLEINVERTYKGIRDYLRDHNIEGIVFWLNDKPVCKIKRSDFGFDWKPMK